MFSLIAGSLSLAPLRVQSPEQYKSNHPRVSIILLMHTHYKLCHCAQSRHYMRWRGLEPGKLQAALDLRLSLPE